MKYLPTSVIVLSLLITSAPLAAFADDSATVNVSGNAQTSQSNDGPGRPAISDAIHGLFANGGVRAHIEASSSDRAEMHMNMDASSTNPGMHRGEGMGSTTRPKPAGMGDGTKVRAHSDTEIDARIGALTKMIARLGDAKRLSTDAKASLTTELNTQISALTSLKGQIGTDATTSLKADAQSITKSFRIYALVLPQAAINAAADRIMTIAADMQTLSGKIGARITAAQTAGADVTAAVAAHADFDAKVADAKIQAQVAVTEVANLAVDAGDATKLAANTAALKDAKTKLDAAQADLKAARADVDSILKALKGKGEVKAGAHATTSANAQ
ncbi:MAG: hypothetical protein JWL88_263 [Parcubacteria group bacterium]|nr:hypothetical protein [Parcubacteria group bacterium]